MIHAAPNMEPARQQATTPSHHGRPVSTMPASTAPTPPSASAPSPPITSMPTRAGISVQNAVRMIGAASVSVFSMENDVPNAPSQSAE